MLAASASPRAIGIRYRPRPFSHACRKPRPRGRGAFSPARGHSTPGRCRTVPARVPAAPAPRLPGVRRLARAVPASRFRPIAGRPSARRHHVPLPAPSDAAVLCLALGTRPGDLADLLGDPVVSPRISRPVNRRKLMHQLRRQFQLSTVLRQHGLRIELLLRRDHHLADLVCQQAHGHLIRLGHGKVELRFVPPQCRLIPASRLVDRCQTQEASEQEAGSRPTTIPRAGLTPKSSQHGQACGNPQTT